MTWSVRANRAYQERPDAADSGRDQACLQLAHPRLADRPPSSALVLVAATAPSPSPVVPPPSPSAQASSRPITGSHSTAKPLPRFLRRWLDSDQRIPPQQVPPVSRARQHFPARARI